MDHINETYINTSAKPILRWFFLPSIPAGKGKAAKHPSSPRAWSTALFATLSTLVKKFHFHFASPLFNPTRARNMERNYEFAGEI